MNIHERDNKLDFQEKSHTYKIKESDEELKSITKLIHEQFKIFDKDKIIFNIIKSKKYMSDPTYKYYKKTHKEISESWDKTRDEGTNVHRIIENYFLNKEEDDIKDKYQKEYEQFKLFLQDHPDFEIYRTEWKIYDEEFKIAGTIDAIFKDNDKFIIIDWKRIKDITPTNKYQKSLTINYLDDCNFNHYSLQLNFYKYILEKNYNIKINDIYLILLHPENDTYKKIKAKDLTYEINKILENKKEIVDESINYLDLL